MKAIVFRKYGELDVLKLKETSKPIPGENEVLVKICASSVNYNIQALVKGEPFVARFWTGLTKPKFNIPGNDIAGRVEAVGKNVTSLKPGEDVFGDISQSGFRALAEYAAVPAEELTLKPENLSYAEAASVPEAALVAFQAIVDKGCLKKGQQVLIHGASGGIGSFAVQFAKYFGAEVTAVCSGKNSELVQSLGADFIIDYTKRSFTDSNKKYDLIVATAGYNSIYKYKAALKPGGIYVSTGGHLKQIFQALILGPWISIFSGKKMGAMMVKPNKDLCFVKELIEAGHVKPIIDKNFPLSETVQALQYYDEGHTRGKVVISIST
jgi:NADPH:quinone reductase-like Zn-dependent oxidoreductase